MLKVSLGDTKKLHYLSVLCVFCFFLEYKIFTHFLFSNKKREFSFSQLEYPKGSIKAK